MTLHLPALRKKYASPSESESRFRSCGVKTARSRAHPALRMKWATRHSLPELIVALDGGSIGGPVVDIVNCGLHCGVTIDSSHRLAVLPRLTSPPTLRSWKGTATMGRTRSLLSTTLLGTLPDCGARKGLGTSFSLRHTDFICIIVRVLTRTRMRRETCRSCYKPSILTESQP